MGVLHLVNRSPGETQALVQCLDRVGAGDAILLLESGVYAAMTNSQIANRLTESMAKVSIHALAPDLAARGIVTEEVLEGIDLVSYEGFVNLSISHHPILSWN
jgi:tRNA 2-thiouridine synthesizing protein B